MRASLAQAFSGSGEETLAFFWALFGGGGDTLPILECILLGLGDAPVLTHGVSISRPMSFSVRRRAPLEPDATIALPQKRQVWRKGVRRTSHQDTH